MEIGIYITVDMPSQTLLYYLQLPVQQPPSPQDQLPDPSRAPRLSYTQQLVQHITKLPLLSFLLRPWKSTVQIQRMQFQGRMSPLPLVQASKKIQFSSVNSLRLPSRPKMLNSLLLFPFLGVPGITFGVSK